MMEVRQRVARLSATETLAALLDEVSAITDYRTLRDSLPRRLARLLCCRCVLLYQRVGETLQFAAGSYDDSPGWSPALLAVARINPIALESDVLEAQAWRNRHVVTAPIGRAQPTCIAAPLLYRQRAIGVLVAMRESLASETSPLMLHGSAAQDEPAMPESWASDEARAVEVIAGVVAMQLENTRLLERDRERISELSLLNSISRQFHASLYERERVRSIVTQRTREIAAADVCDCLLIADPPGKVSWITPDLQMMLRNHFGETSEASSEPLVLERTGNEYATAYFKYLPPNVKTFFALPLWRRSKGEQAKQFDILANEGNAPVSSAGMYHRGGKATLSGMIVGGYAHPWKLRREEIMLLSVLANQASVVLENIALVADVVEARKEARKLLRQVLDDQRFKELILESIPGGLITVDLHGQMTTVNHAAQVMLAYHPYEIIGESAHKIFPLRLLQHVMQSGATREETLTVVDGQGQDKTLDVTFLPLRDDRGQIIGALATFSDVTIVRRLEEEKRRLDRLASLGEMAASVAHEVRNPLASIKTSMQMLLDDLAGDASPVSDKAVTWQADEGMRDSVRVVLKEVERLDSIVRDLLLFSRPRSFHPIACNVVEVCERVLSLIAPRCAEVGVVVHRVYANAPSAQVDVAQVEQVLLNLCINALQAMSEGGILTVSCHVRQLSVTGVPAEMRNWLEIAVSDTGTGIASDQIERIFQPFYTTKAHGIGLGLPISRRLVEDHHGTLSVESQTGYGATFTIRLLLADEWAGQQGLVDEEEQLS